MAFAFQHITKAPQAVINKTIVSAEQNDVPIIGWEITDEVPCYIDPSTCTMLKDAWYYININKTELTNTLHQKGIIEKITIDTTNRSISIWRLTKHAYWLGFNPTHGGLNHIKLKPQALMEWIQNGLPHADSYKPPKMHMMTHDKQVTPINELIL
jgi:hypothetical protein